MSGIRSILLQLDATPAAAMRLRVARDLARRHEAHLAVMFVTATSNWPPRLAPDDDTSLFLQTSTWAEQDRAMAMFDAAQAPGGPPMQWLDGQGTDAVELFCQQALYADLLVLAQHDAGAVLPVAAPADFVTSALVRSGRPSLVLPATGAPASFGHQVLLCWNATAPAARVLNAALPWLRQARQVHVLDTTDSQGGSVIGEALDISQYLRFHGVTAVLHRRQLPPADVCAQVLALAYELVADLLVMPCAGHCRQREWVLDDSAHSLLRKMPSPLLMCT